MLQFEYLSNELILCVWDQLTAADVMYSFSHLNTRIDSLPLKFRGLYKQLDLRYCSLSACRFFCRQVPFRVSVCKSGFGIMVKLKIVFLCRQEYM
jgi:hypothetical protein